MDSETNRENHADGLLTEISFSDIFILDEIQQLQDLFSEATGIASLITHPDGTPITSPSNICRLCNDIIRKTDQGSASCLKSDLNISRLSASGRVSKPCLSAGLWDAGASISVNGQHIATWLIGQIRNAESDDEKMRQYADEIGADRDEFLSALSGVPIMPAEQFKKVTKMLFAFANELSEKAYANLQLKHQVEQQKEITARLIESEERFQVLFEAAPDAIFLADPVTKKILDANNKACLLLGREREVIKEMYQHQLHPGDQDTLSKETFNDQIIQSAERGFTHPFENIVLRANGDLIPVEIMAQLVSINEEKLVIGTFRDISERKVAETRLKESEEKHRILFMNSPDSYLIIADGLITDCNSATERMLGVDRTRIIGCTPEALSPEFQPDGQSSSEAAKERIRQAEKQGSATFEWVHNRFDGSEFSVEVSIALIVLDGKSALFTTWRDISARKQAENTILRSEEKYHALVDNVFEGILIINLEGKILFANKSLIRTFEYENLEEFIGENVFQYIAPESIPQAMEDLKKVENGIAIEVANYGGITSKGNKIWFESIGKIIEYEGVVADIISVRDITAKKLAEAKLAENESKFKAITETANDAIIVTSNKGLIVFSNPRAYQIFGYEENEFAGLTLEMLMPERYRNLHSTNFELFVAGDNDYFIGKTRELSAIRKNGSEFTMEISLSKWETSSGVFVAAHIRDITERKNTEQELIKARDRAEESDRLKSAFLANMSHEIRTPMNGILGFAELLKMPGLSGEQQQEFIRIIKKSGDRMLNIIDDIIDISKIESGQMKVLLSDTSINDQIEYIFAFFRPETESKGIHFYYKNGLSAQKSIIKTDQEKVYAILTNLVKNAIKYTNEGTIEFGYIPTGSVVKLNAGAADIENPESNDSIDSGELCAAVTEPAELQFYVKDTGIGIPFDRQKAIFDRFVQADIADTRAYQGAGLGLSITKAYVEMLGGKLWVESRILKGSTFYFTIPLLREADEIIARKKDLPEGEELLRTHKLKILIAEDDETSEIFLVIALKEISKMVLKAKTGTEAVAACRNNPDIDLILMDIKMPQMDGYEATRQIRQFNKEVIIIAQTAFGLTGDREKAIKAGCNDYLPKPLSKKELMDIISCYF